MTDHQTPKGTTQAGELLDELESIKSLLDDDDLNSIPLLEEMIDDVPPVITQTVSAEDAPTLSDPSTLPGQQALFDEPSTDKPSPPKARTKPSSDNPFLPKHIRERLGSSVGYAQELEQQQKDLAHQSLTMPFSHQVPSALDEKISQTPSKTPLQQLIANPDELIDSLVQQYLPVIEDDLRQQLKALIDKS